MKLRDNAVENRQFEIRCCIFSISTFKTNSIASGLQYFIGLYIRLCYGSFKIYQKLTLFFMFIWRCQAPDR